MPPLIFGKCGVPSSEHSTARLPPHSVPRASTPSRPASVRKPMASSEPSIASRKQSRVISSTPPSLSARPKSSQAIGPAQLVCLVWASSASCSAVTSLRPTQRVPRSTLRAIRVQSIRSSSRVRP